MFKRDSVDSVTCSYQTNTDTYVILHWNATWISGSTAKCQCGL